MTRIDYATALAAVQAVVAERGENFVYRPPTWMKKDKVTGEENLVTACVYFDRETGEPSCGVGAALGALGVERDDLVVEAPEWRAERIQDLNSGAGVSALQTRGVLDLTPKAQEFLQTFQSGQDSGARYSDALSWAVETADGLVDE